MRICAVLFNLSDTSRKIIIKKGEELFSYTYMIYLIETPGHTLQFAAHSYGFVYS